MAELKKKPSQIELKDKKQLKIQMKMRRKTKTMSSKLMDYKLEESF